MIQVLEIGRCFLLGRSDQFERLGHEHQILSIKFLINSIQPLHQRSEDLSPKGIDLCRDGCEQDATTVLFRALPVDPTFLLKSVNDVGNRGGFQSDPLC